MKNATEEKKELCKHRKPIKSRNEHSALHKGSGQRKNKQREAYRERERNKEIINKCSEI